MTAAFLLLLITLYSAPPSSYSFSPHALQQRALQQRPFRSPANDPGSLRCRSSCPPVRSLWCLYAQPKSLGKSGDWEIFIDENSKQKYYFNMKTGESMWTPPPGTNFDSKQQAAKADSPSFALPNLFSNDAKKKATTTTAASTTVTKQQATAATVDTVVEKPVYTDGGTKLALTLHLTRLR